MTEQAGESLEIGWTGFGFLTTLYGKIREVA